MGAIPPQYQTDGYGTIFSDAEARTAIANVEIANKLGGSSPGGGGEGGITQGQVTAAIENANNLDGIEPALLELLKEGTPISGQTLEAGGSGALGWYSSLRKLLGDRLVPDVNGRLLSSAIVTEVTLPVAFNTGTASATTVRTVTANDSPDITVLGNIDGKLPTVGTKSATGSLSNAPAATTQSATITTSGQTLIFDCLGYSLLAIQAFASGASSGNYTFEISNNNTNWSTITLRDTVSSPSGTSLIFTKEYLVSYRYLKVVFDTVGAGTPWTVIGYLSNSTTSENTTLGSTNEGAATSDTGTFSLIRLIKRLLSVKLPSSLGQKNSANSFATTLSSEQETILGAIAKEGTAITGQNLEAGGASTLGWLSSIKKAIADFTTSLLGVASGTADSGNPVKIGAKYNSVLPTLVNGQRGDLQIDANGRLLTTSTASLSASYNTGAADASTLRTVTASNSPDVVSLGNIDTKIPANLTVTATRLLVDNSGVNQPVVGNVASGVADVGNPVKFGGVFNTTRPTFVNGQRGDIQLTSRGGLLADYEDYVTNPNNINTVDSGSTTTAGANNQNIITGNPTNNSTVSTLFSGNSSFAVLITGTFVGTLQFERTLDGGTTWTSIGAFSAGTNYATQTTTAPGAFHGNSSSSNGIRVRATTWTSGVASVRILLGHGTGTITIGNPIRLWDQTNGTQATIRPSSSAPIATDTALVVSPRVESISPTLYQITLTAINTEYSQVITSAKKLAFKVLSGSDIRYAYTTGKVAGSVAPYYTLSSLSEESEDFVGNDRFTGTLYLATSTTAGTTVIIKVWS